jgi:hypothetical protein
MLVTGGNVCLGTLKAIQDESCLDAGPFPQFVPEQADASDFPCVEGHSGQQFRQPLRGLRVKMVNMWAQEREGR